MDTTAVAAAPAPESAPCGAAAAEPGDPADQSVRVDRPVASESAPQPATTQPTAASPPAPTTASLRRSMRQTTPVSYRTGGLKASTLPKTTGKRRKPAGARAGTAVSPAAAAAVATSSATAGVPASVPLGPISFPGFNSRSNPRIGGGFQIQNGAGAPRKTCTPSGLAENLVDYSRMLPRTLMPVSQVRIVEEDLAPATVSGDASSEPLLQRQRLEQQRQQVLRSQAGGSTAVNADDMAGLSAKARRRRIRRRLEQRWRRVIGPEKQDASLTGGPEDQSAYSPEAAVEYAMDAFELIVGEYDSVADNPLAQHAEKLERENRRLRDLLRSVLVGKRSIQEAWTASTAAEKGVAVADSDAYWQALGVPLDGMDRWRTLVYKHIQKVGDVAFPDPLVMTPEEKWREGTYLNVDLRYFNLASLPKFDVVLVDPPWRLRGNENALEDRPMFTNNDFRLDYNTMSREQLMDLNVATLSDHGFLFLWTITSQLDFSVQLMKAWGYTLVDRITWVKKTVNDNIAVCQGFYMLHSTELCLVGIKQEKGRVLEYIGRVSNDVIFSEWTGKSSKPYELYRIIEQMLPGARKVELFARNNNIRRGWLSLGNQLGPEHNYVKDRVVCDGCSDIIPLGKLRYKARYVANRDYCQQCFEQRFGRVREASSTNQADSDGCPVCVSLAPHPVPVDKTAEAAVPVSSTGSDQLPAAAASTAPTVVDGHGDQSQSSEQAARVALAKCTWWVCCDLCDAWYHGWCALIPARHLIPDLWLCHVCAKPPTMLQQDDDGDGKDAGNTISAAVAAAAVSASTQSADETTASGPSPVPQESGPLSVTQDDSVPIATAPPPAEVYAIIDTVTPPTADSASITTAAPSSEVSATNPPAHQNQVESMQSNAAATVTASTHSVCSDTAAAASSALPMVSQAGCAVTAGAEATLSIGVAASATQSTDAVDESASTLPATTTTTTTTATTTTVADSADVTTAESVAKPATAPTPMPTTTAAKADGTDAASECVVAKPTATTATTKMTTTTTITSSASASPLRPPGNVRQFPLDFAMPRTEAAPLKKKRRATPPAAEAKKSMQDRSDARSSARKPMMPSLPSMPSLTMPAAAQAMQPHQSEDLFSQQQALASIMAAAVIRSSGVSTEPPRPLPPMYSTQARTRAPHASAQQPVYPHQRGFVHHPVSVRPEGSSFSSSISGVDRYSSSVYPAAVSSSYLPLVQQPPSYPLPSMYSGSDVSSSYPMQYEPPLTNATTSATAILDAHGLLNPPATGMPRSLTPPPYPMPRGVPPYPRLDLSSSRYHPYYPSAPLPDQPDSSSSLLTTFPAPAVRPAWPTLPTMLPSPSLVAAAYVAAVAQTQTQSQTPPAPETAATDVTRRAADPRAATASPVPSSADASPCVVPDSTGRAGKLAQAELASRSRQRDAATRILDDDTADDTTALDTAALDLSTDLDDAADNGDDDSPGDHEQQQQQQQQSVEDIDDEGEEEEEEEIDVVGDDSNQVPVSPFVKRRRTAASAPLPASSVPLSPAQPVLSSVRVRDEELSLSYSCAVACAVLNGTRVPQDSSSSAPVKMSDLHGVSAPSSSGSLMMHRVSSPPAQCAPTTTTTTKSTTAATTTTTATASAPSSAAATKTSQVAMATPVVPALATPSSTAPTTPSMTTASPAAGSAPPIASAVAAPQPPQPPQPPPPMHDPAFAVAKPLIPPDVVKLVQAGQKRLRRRRRAQQSSASRRDAYFVLDNLVDEMVFHKGYQCDGPGCTMDVIWGIRFQCIDCYAFDGPGFDLCEGCYDKHEAPPRRLRGKHTGLHRWKAIEVPDPSGGAVAHRVKCRACQAFPILGNRFVCLQCPKMSLCQNCFFLTRTPGSHLPSHQMEMVDQRMHPLMPSNMPARCGGCQVYPIVGVRYTCDSCFYFDLCSICFARGPIESPYHPSHRKYHKMTRVV